MLAAAPGLALADPLTVTFPTLGMQAQTEDIGVLDGQLGVPHDPDDLGAYEVPGNLLLVGHLDWAGKRRLLAFVRSFQGGEPIQLSDGRTYHVAWSEQVPVDDSSDAWSQAVAPADDVLTLITCDGPFSLSRHMYLDRFILRAVRDS
jgi:hypothetical protein